MLKLYIDQRIGGVPRHYMAKEPNHLMLVPDEIRQCVVFVAYLLDDSFVKVGTAFLMSYPSRRDGYSFRYVVTAKHLIAKIREKDLRDVYLRINTLSGFQWVATPIEEWIEHPDDYTLDASVYPFSLPREMFEYKTIPMSMIVTQQVVTDYSIGVGEDIFLTGLFSKHVGNKKNIPIVRTGTIAVMADPDELVEVNIMGRRYEIEAYLIESRSIGGLSGSPVFASLGIMSLATKKSRHGELFLLGIVHGHWRIEVRPDEYEEDATSLPIEEMVNMGIAIVTPAYKVLELLEQPFLVDMRQRADDEDAEKDPPTTDPAGE